MLKNKVHIDGMSREEGMREGSAESESIQKQISAATKQRSGRINARCIPTDLGMQTLAPNYHADINTGFL